jgi:hypothetical protein
MNPRIENTMSRIADDARGRYARLVRQARRRSESAASRVTMGKKPIKAMTGLGLKLTAISHKTADKVLQQQTRLVENQIDALAGRLKAAADARNVRDLLSTQIRLIPQNVSRFAADTRDTLSIVAGAGSEVRNVLKSTMAELRTGPRGKTRAVRKNAVKKTARKVAKKPAKKASKLRRKSTVNKDAAATKAVA